MILNYSLLDSEQYICRQFALMRILGSTELYAIRGELSNSKIVEDIRTGAAAEQAVFKLLKGLNLPVTEPDFAIYEAKQKSFEPDLKCGKFNLHVKSQTLKSAHRYGSSWLFQKEDPLMNLDSDNDLLVFCIVDCNEVSLQSIISINEVRALNLIDKPRVARYQETKVALYLESILESNKKGEEKWIQKLQEQK